MQLILGGNVSELSNRKWNEDKVPYSSRACEFVHTEQFPKQRSIACHVLQQHLMRGSKAISFSQCLQCMFLLSSKSCLSKLLTSTVKKIVCDTQSPIGQFMLLTENEKQTANRNLNILFWFSP